MILKFKTMKKLMILAIALLTFQVTMAQEGNPEMKRQKQSRMQDMTPEEAANLKSKRMTLNLDLSDKQQKQVYELFLKNEQERQQLREAHRNQSEKPTKEQKLQWENARLDKQIEMKKKMKDILNEEQYAKWEKNMESRRNNFEKKKGKRKMTPQD